MKSGFQDIEDDYIDRYKECTHPGHNPPSLLHIPQGKVYVHVCPSCGQSVTLTNCIRYKL